MEFSFKNNIVTISSDKKSIILENNTVTLDGFLVDVAGEYEKSGFLLYSREHDGIKYFHFRVEGYWLAYISLIPSEIPASILDFFGQLDILIAPFSKSEQKFLEQIEPKMLISTKDTASDLVQILGMEVSSGDSYKLKSQDISSEKTTLVILS